MTSPPRALERVRKLLALATSPNPHEAALAAARAQALIEAHRLQAWLDAEAEVRDDRDPITSGDEQPLEVAKKIRPWKRVLASVLAEANGCIAYVSDHSEGQAVLLVGRQRDREGVLVLWEWLVRRIEWLSATHGSGRSRKWHEGFRIGVVEAIAEQLSTVAQEVRSQVDPTALVRVEPAYAAHREALDRFADEHLRLGRGRGITVDVRAVKQGRAAAPGIPLPPRR